MADKKPLVNYSGTIQEIGTGDSVAIANGGTGAVLTDPNADRIMFWDDSAGAVTWLTAGTGLSISGTTITASATVTDVTTVIGGVLAKRKTTGESVNSSTALQDDNHFAFSVSANSTYLVFGMWGVSAGAAGGFKVDFVCPTSATFNYSVVEISGTSFLSTTNDSGTPYGTTAAMAIQRPVDIRGLLTVGANSGTFKLQWAQNASSGTPTSVNQNSYLALVKLT